MATLGERLREVRGRITREAAGARLGITPTSLQRYEGNQRIPDVEFLVKFCSEFQVDVRWLLSGEGSQRDETASVEEAIETLSSVPTQNLGLVAVPFFEARAGAGAQQIAWDEKPAKSIFLPQDLFLLRGIRPNHAGLMLSSGTSMEPTISDGDLLMLDMADKSRSDGIFVIGRDGGVLVKRLQWRSDGSLIMLSDNKAYEPEPLPRDDADDLRIIGRVRMVFKSV